MNAPFAIICRNLQVQQVYDGVDMFVEALVYVPTVFTINFISTCILHKRYFDSVRARVYGLAGLGLYISKTLPGLNGIRERCDTRDAPEYLRVIHKRPSGQGKRFEGVYLRVYT